MKRTWPGVSEQLFYFFYCFSWKQLEISFV
jgi:hypothetical protein